MTLKSNLRNRLSNYAANTVGAESKTADSATKTITRAGFSATAAALSVVCTSLAPSTAEAAPATSTFTSPPTVGPIATGFAFAAVPLPGVATDIYLNHAAGFGQRIFTYAFFSGVVMDGSGGIRRFTSGSITNAMSFNTAGGPFSPFELWNTASGSAVAPEWSGQSSGFIGFRTSTGNLGWIQIQRSSTGALGDPALATMSALRSGLESVSGASITLPALGGGGAVPEPSTGLMALAFGAVGIAAWRRQQKKKEAPKTA